MSDYASIKNRTIRLRKDTVVSHSNGTISLGNVDLSFDYEEESFHVKTFVSGYNKKNEPLIKAQMCRKEDRMKTNGPDIGEEKSLGVVMQDITGMKVAVNRFLGTNSLDICSMIQHWIDSKSTMSYLWIRYSYLVCGMRWWSHVVPVLTPFGTIEPSVFSFLWMYSCLFIQIHAPQREKLPVNMCRLRKRCDIRGCALHCIVRQVAME